MLVCLGFDVRTQTLVAARFSDGMFRLLRLFGLAVELDELHWDIWVVA